MWGCANAVRAFRAIKTRLLFGKFVLYSLTVGHGYRCTFSFEKERTMSFFFTKKKKDEKEVGDLRQVDRLCAWNGIRQSPPLSRKSPRTSDCLLPEAFGEASDECRFFGELLIVGWLFLRCADGTSPPPEAWFFPRRVRMKIFPFVRRRGFCKNSVTFCKANRVHKLGQRVPRHQI